MHKRSTTNTFHVKKFVNERRSKGLKLLEELTYVQVERDIDWVSVIR